MSLLQLLNPWIMVEKGGKRCQGTSTSGAGRTKTYADGRGMYDR